MARIQQNVIRVNVCWSQRHGRKVIYILYTKLNQRVYVVVPLSGKTCPRQLSRIIAMDSTKSQNKFLRVLTFISTLLYMKLVINVMQLQIILGVQYFTSRFIILY